MDVRSVWASADEMKRPTRSEVVCLCTRRRNPDVLLITRRFYSEASQIFWAENTFAFHRRRSLELFLHNIPVECRNMITRISLTGGCLNWMFSYRPDGWNLETSIEEHSQHWDMLALCKSLRHLELSAHFLTDLHITKALRKIHGIDSVTLSLAKPVSHGSMRRRRYDSSEDLDGSSNKSSGLTIAEREQCTEKYKFAMDMALLMRQEVQPSVEAILTLYNKYEDERLMLEKCWRDLF